MTKKYDFTQERAGMRGGNEPVGENELLRNSRSRCSCFRSGASPAPACDYLTPPELVTKCLKTLNEFTGLKANMFSLDVCCSFKNIPALNHYIDGEKDGLKENWRALNFCNPPYNECGKWVRKAYEEYLKGNTSVLLIPARAETAYWQDYILPEIKSYVHIKFLKKNYKFLHPETKKPMGVYKNPLAIVIFDGISRDIAKEWA